jgi:UPF0755 protein
MKFVNNRTKKEKQIAAAVIALVALLSLLVLLQPHHDFSDAKPGPVIEVSIPDGATGTQIAYILVASGVIKQAPQFIREVLNDPKAGGISPGVHRIQTHISSKLAISQLLDQKQIINVLKIIEGETLSDVLAKLSKNDHISKGKFSLTGVKPLYSNLKNSLEGSIFPAQYSFAPATSASDAVTAMVSRARTNAQSIGLAAGYLKYSPFQVLTIASMVQIEGDPASYAKVARVIYNRLNIGMPLQLNSTVQYATNHRGRIALSRNATKTPSLYNTYLHQGLPPTPISNPGEAAIVASLHPTDGDWLYFITVKPGDTRFTKDFAVFQNWTTEFNNNLAAGVFK